MKEPEEFSIRIRFGKKVQLTFQCAFVRDILFFFEIYIRTSIELLTFSQIRCIAAACGKSREQARHYNKRKRISQGEYTSHLFLFLIRNRLERDAEEFVEIDHEHSANPCLGDISVNSAFV